MEMSGKSVTGHACGLRSRAGRRLVPLLAQFGKPLQIGLHLQLETEFLLDDLATARAQAASTIRMLQHLACAGGHRLKIARADQEPALTILDLLWNPTNGGCNDG